MPLERTGEGRAPRRTARFIASRARYDLKAVNPQEKKATDTRTTEQLLEAIAVKGKEVDAALEQLRSLF